VKLMQGQPSTAVALLERSLRHAAKDSLDAVRTLELLVDAHLANANLRTACTALERLESIAAQEHWHEAVGRAAMAAGRVAGARGDREAGIACFEKAAATFTRLEMPLETVRARLALAFAIGDESQAIAVSEAQGALAAFERLGAAADAAMAAARLRSLGVNRPGPKGAGLLTRREEEVLRLVAAGLSKPEIAGRLYISRKTAAHHVSSLLAKLGLRNRTEAVAAYTTRLSA
jgi:DNA-binding NarL/FixJ family response regulator